MSQQSPRAKASQTMETKQRILKAALELFNEHGSSSVTTHDIAEKAGISPGNLYYHFKNKHEIVRGLFYQIEIFSIREWWEKSPANRDVRFSDFMRFYFESISKHRFFFREISSLLAQDQVLAKEWRRTYSELMSVMEEALDGWIKQGLIKAFPSKKEARIFIDTVWTLAAFSQVHIDSQKTAPTPKGVSGVHEILAHFLYPYHTPKGQRAIELYLR